MFGIENILKSGRTRSIDGGLGPMRYLFDWSNELQIIFPRLVRFFESYFLNENEMKMKMK